MQALPYLVVEGTVVGTRRVELDAREPEDYTTASGEVRKTRGRAASSYFEAGVNCPAVLNGVVDADLRALLTVRVPESVQSELKKGVVVRWAVQVEQLKVFMGGRFREWLVYQHRGDAPATAAAASLTSVTRAS